MFKIGQRSKVKDQRAKNETTAIVPINKVVGNAATEKAPLVDPEVVAYLAVVDALDELEGVVVDVTTATAPAPAPAAVALPV